MSENLVVAKEQVDRIQNKVKTFKIVFIVISIAFGMLLPYGFGNAPSAIFMIVLFCILLFGWIKFGILASQKNLLVAMSSSHFTVISEIAKNTGKPKNKIIRQLKALIKKGYLRAWKLSTDNTEIISTDGKVLKCPYCGGRYKPEDKICEYCGGSIRA